MKIIPSTIFRNNISSLLDAVTHRGQVVGIGRRNKIEAIVLKWPSHHNSKLDEVTNVNANSASFEFLGDEPDLYSIEDLRKRYV